MAPVQITKKPKEHVMGSGTRIAAIQANLVNAGSYRTHLIRHAKEPRLLGILFGTKANPGNPRHWIEGALRGWVIGDDYEVEDPEDGCSAFISVTIYLSDRGTYMAAVEEGWGNDFTGRPGPYEHLYSVFHASPYSCDTPERLHEWLSDGWKHSTAFTGAWEKACRTYPPMLLKGS